MIRLIDMRGEGCRRVVASTVRHCHCHIRLLDADQTVATVSHTAT